MTIILVGLNHRTAPIELREQLALNGCAFSMALEALKAYTLPATADTATSPLPEGIILSTCNRLEVYAVASNAEDGWQSIEYFLSNLQNIPPEKLQPHLYYLEGEAAITHLMRVACGLDSMILGEPQILGQVTHAFEDARTAGLIGPVLSRLFPQAIHAGKIARTHTDISRYTTSVSHAGARLVLEKLNGLQTPNILVIGAGEMAVLAATALQKYVTTNITFINRTYSHAEALAQEIGGQSMHWHQLTEALTWADAVITATGAPHTVLYTSDLQPVLAKRAGRPLLFVDIAVPRDVEITIDALDTVQRFDIDDLQSIVDENTTQRESAIPQVEAIILKEINTFQEWYFSRHVTPIIQDLRQWANGVAQSELEQALNKLQGADDHTVQTVNRLVHRLVNKLLHEPTVRLRGQAVEGNGFGYAHAVSELFGLNSVDCDMRWQGCHRVEPTTRAEDTGTACNLQCILPIQKQG